MYINIMKKKGIKKVDQPANSLDLHFIKDI